jgi:6-phosphogluconate dehydrogenase
MATETPMQLGMVGLGRMGANLVRRLLRDGHRCAGTDVSPDAVRLLAVEGMTGAATTAELVATLERPRTVWVMVPAGEITEAAVGELGSLLEEGDTVIDGGNTRYHDDIRRARSLAERGIHYVDVGTSGGVFGLERGFCLMVGGEDDAVGRLAPLFT